MSPVGWARAQIFAVLVVVTILLVWVSKSCQPTDRPKIDAQTQFTLDSLSHSQPAVTRRTDSVLTIIKHDTIFSASHAAKAQQSSADAATVGKLADSLATMAQRAQSADSASNEWHGAYVARTLERDTLLVTVQQKDSAYRDQRDARLQFQYLYVQDTIRRNIISDANEHLQRDIAKLQTPCTIPGTFGKIACPSRTIVGVLSAVTGYVVGKAQNSGK